MCLTLIDCESIEAAPLPEKPKPVDIIVSVVRERARARKLNILQADEAVKAALDKFLLVRSLTIAIDCGQRKADALAAKPIVHPWKTSYRHDDTQPPRSAA